MSQSKDGQLKLLISTPCYGGLMTVSYAVSLFNAIQEAQRYGIASSLSFQTNESLITRARNRAVREFLASDCTHLLFIDADIGFPSDSFHKLLLRNRDVVGALYPKKAIAWERIEAAAKRGISPVQPFACDYVVNTATAQVEMRGGEIEVKDLGTGFMLIRRSVLEKMVKEMPELLMYPTQDDNHPFPLYNVFDCLVDPVSKVYLSEDYAFCRRWQQLGGKIYADLTIDLTHTGTHTFSGSMQQYLNGLQTLNSAQTPANDPNVEVIGQIPVGK